jgi:hypothetical protein
MIIIWNTGAYPSRFDAYYGLGAVENWLGGSSAGFSSGSGLRLLALMGVGL